MDNGTENGDTFLARSPSGSHPTVYQWEQCPLLAFTSEWLALRRVAILLAMLKSCWSPGFGSRVMVAGCGWAGPSAAASLIPKLVPASSVNGGVMRVVVECMVESWPMVY